jgi:hypothetical protein
MYIESVIPLFQIIKSPFLGLEILGKFVPEYKPLNLITPSSELSIRGKSVIVILI